MEVRVLRFIHILDLADKIGLVQVGMAIDSHNIIISKFDKHDAGLGSSY